MAAMLLMHDVTLACQELYRGVKEYGAVGAVRQLPQRPLLAFNYWDPLYGRL